MVRSAKERAREYYQIATWAFIGLAALYSILLRIYLAWDLPLWLDESWTAVLSAAPDLRTFVDYMWTDINAPFYFLLMWLWPVESDLGLRIPSFIFLLAAALIVVLWRPSAVRRDTAFVWAALLLLWQPGIGLFIDARYYALLMLLCTAQTITFIKLLDEPTLKRACWWTGLATLAVTTHYYAALPALIQGLVYILHHRIAAARTWPALLLVLPGACWGVYHLPRLLAFADPKVAWYSVLQLSDLPHLLSWPFAINWIAALCLAALIAVFFSRERIDSSVRMAVAASFLALACFILLGFLRPLMMDRYLIPVVPALLLGVASALRPAGYMPVVASFFVTMGSPVEWTQRVENLRWFGLQLPARELPHAKRVTWVFDYEKPSILEAERRELDAVLVDAFKRSGRVIEASYGGDLTAGDGLIWLNPPKGELLAKVETEWNCKSFDGGGFSTVVCSHPIPSQVQGR